MKLSVDYTNYKGKREWREIIPINIEVGGYHTDFENGKNTSETTFLLNVHMLDRDGARRSLKMANIHGFKIEEGK